MEADKRAPAPPNIECRNTTLTWRELLRDFLRGYSEEDIERLDAKLLEAECGRPVETVQLSKPELAALGERLLRHGRLPKMLIDRSRKKESQPASNGTAERGRKCR